MLSEIYKKAFSILMQKPFRLWGISLLCGVLGGLASVCFGLLPIVGFAVCILLETAMTIIYLNGYRGEYVETKQLFFCFKDWATIKRVLCGMGWMYLWIFLWSLIPIVGIIFAIIRTYEYRLTPYILVLEPDVPITDAIKVSRARTAGWKGSMFLADLLAPLGVFVAFTILSSIFTKLGSIGVFFDFILMLAYFVAMILMPLFLGLVGSAYYEEINASLVAPQPPIPPQNPEPYIPQDPIAPQDPADVTPPAQIPPQNPEPPADFPPPADE